MDRDGILIMVILCLIVGGYLAFQMCFQHTIREGLTGWWNIKSEQDCTAAGGSSYASCSADGTQYCAGPCTGPGHKCMVPPDPSKVDKWKKLWVAGEIIHDFETTLGAVMPSSMYVQAANVAAEKCTQPNPPDIAHCGGAYGRIPPFPAGGWNGLQWNACINPGRPSRLGKPYATKSTMKCPPEYPYLLKYSNGDKYCYENSDGNATGRGKLCNCDCLDCGFNSSFPNCKKLGSKYSCQTCNYLFEKGPTA